MYDCQLCMNQPIPPRVYELLDWEAAADDELIICPKCLAGLMKKEASVEIKLQKKSAVLVRVIWNHLEVGDEQPGSGQVDLSSEGEDEE